MLFKTYMIKNFIDDKGCKGSLARGIKSDGKNFPVRTAHDFYRRYFEKYKQADDGVLDAAQALAAYAHIHLRDLCLEHVLELLHQVGKCYCGLLKVVDHAFAYA